MKDDEWRKLYQKYRKATRKLGLPQMNFGEFKESIIRAAADELIGLQDQKFEDTSHMIYCGVREPHIESVPRKCVRCKLTCYVDARRANLADNAKAIVCDVCVEHDTGKTATQIFVDQMPEVFNGK